METTKTQVDYGHFGRWIPTWKKTHESVSGLHKSEQKRKNTKVTDTFRSLWWHFSTHQNNIIDRSNGYYTWMYGRTDNDMTQGGGRQSTYEQNEKVMGTFKWKEKSQKYQKLLEKMTKKIKNMKKNCLVKITLHTLPTLNPQYLTM